jgi:hypothetical protein
VETSQPSNTGVHANADGHGHESGDDRIQSDTGTEPSEPATDAVPLAYCDAAAALLDAQLAENSPYGPIWASLNEKHPDQTRIVIWLQRIEAIQETTRQETQDALRAQENIDMFGYDVLAAVDEVLVINAAAEGSEQSEP